ncbi:hypothetical protein BsIDN1_33800 [Bacillus safensis]|uniref:NAD(P)-binding domain-containing protein n=1 Tax=Bacillus safensis TaxID=561879 RepID=A0A5S9MAZ0_BACIA|nr:hypothetical protein BsIDN1_33800 [Bacillus safensis]
MITLATPALQSEDDKKSLSTILPRILPKLFMPNGYAEMKKIGELIKQSNLDWTVVRIINPNIKYKGQSYGYSFGDQPAKMSVSRRMSLNSCMTPLGKSQLIGKMPIVYNH